MSSARFPCWFARIAFSCLVTLSLAACGGGGGGSGGDKGGFTLGATTASFRALRNGAAAPEVRIPITVTGSAVAAVGAAFVGQPQPPWLFVNIEGTGRNLTLVLRANSTTMAAGQYTATVTVGTADQNQDVLSSREVRVTYELLVAMTATATPLDTSFVIGSSHSTESITLVVGAPGKTWTLTSNQPWLTVPAGNQQGDQTLTLTLDGSATGQAGGGTAVAQLTVQNAAEPMDKQVLTFHAAIVAPKPIVTANPIVLGGSTGLGPYSQQVDVSLDTGTNAHPWTLTLDPAQSPGWVVSDVSTGTISGVQHATVTFSVRNSIGAAANYSATANFDVAVANQTFRTSVPITLKWHGQRLVPEQDGVAFSSFPSGLRPAARTLKVRSSRGLNGVAWTASSDQSWLTVTPSGVTGGDLVLTANAAGHPVDQLSVARVTLSSASPGIERSESIRVGLWVGSVDPANVDAPLSIGPFAIAVNPVEPYAYALRGSVIHVFNVYTGTEITTFTDAEFDNIAGGGTAYPTSMELSSDGGKLFIANGRTARVLALNAATGAVIHTYQLIAPFGLPLDSALRYGRTNGYPVLWTPFGDIATQVIDLETDTPVQLTRTGVMDFERFDAIRALTPDGARLYTMVGGSTSDTLQERTTAFGVLGGRTLEVNPTHESFVLDGGFAREMCVNAAGTRLYARNVNEVEEVAIDQQPPKRLRQVPRPDPSHTSPTGLDCHWNGRVYVGLSTFSAPQNNAFVLDEAGNDAGAFLSGPAASGAFGEQMRLSGDASRVISTRSLPPTPPSTSLGYVLSFYNVP